MRCGGSGVSPMKLILWGSIAVPARELGGRAGRGEATHHTAQQSERTTRNETIRDDQSVERNRARARVPYRNPAAQHTRNSTASASQTQAQAQAQRVTGSATQTSAVRVGVRVRT
jgi:hypothetical protein